MCPPRRVRPLPGHRVIQQAQIAEVQLALHPGRDRGLGRRLAGTGAPELARGGAHAAGVALGSLGLAATQARRARLAIVDARTGRLRLVAGARYLIGAATLWAGAIPGREEILAGGPANAYLVNAVTLAERAVYFLPGDHRSLDISRESTTRPPSPGMAADPAGDCSWVQRGRPNSRPSR